MILSRSPWTGGAGTGTGEVGKNISIFQFPQVIVIWGLKLRMPGFAQPILNPTGKKLLFSIIRALNLERNWFFLKYTLGNGISHSLISDSLHSTVRAYNDRQP